MHDHLGVIRWKQSRGLECFGDSAFVGVPHALHSSAQEHPNVLQRETLVVGMELFEPEKFSTRNSLKTVP